MSKKLAGAEAARLLLVLRPKIRHIFRAERIVFI